MADSAAGSRRVLDRMFSEIRGWGCWSVREARDDAELPAPPVQIAHSEPGLAEVQYFTEYPPLGHRSLQEAHDTDPVAVLGGRGGGFSA